MVKGAVTTLTRSLSTAAPCLRAIIKGRKRGREKEEGIKEADSKSDGNQCAKSSESWQAVGLRIHVRDIALLSDELKTVNDRRVARKPGGTILYVMQHLRGFVFLSVLQKDREGCSYPKQCYNICYSSKYFQSLANKSVSTEGSEMLMKDDPAGTRQKCASSLSVESRQNRRPRRRLSVPFAAQNPLSLSH